MPKNLILTHLFILLSANLAAQQVIDESFNLPVQNPSFDSGEGPTICIDEAHNNFHTLDGNYKAFGKLIESDGFKPAKFAREFSARQLTECDVLTISNAIGDGNRRDWSYPHDSAFTRDEIAELVHWVSEGGNLLLIADHPPMAGAASALGAAIGLVMTDVYADGTPAGDDIFTRADDTLHEHSILNGKEDSESINSLMTFTGQPVQITQGWEPLITFGPEARGFINPRQTVQLTQENTRRANFSIAGWTHAAARELGEGRIVFLGEAAMCTAQLAGPNQIKMGMNNPNANQNAQFCLNVIQWLSGVIE